MLCALALSVGGSDMRVFCDYLNVTFNPEVHPADDVGMLLLDHGAVLRCEGLFGVGDGGTVKVGKLYGVMRISASGAALAWLREVGIFMDFVSLLASCPHRVTLLDLALDVPTDAPPVLAALQRRYSGSRVSLSRKGLEWSVIMSERPSDGAMTGSFYVGRKSAARVTARVYDKQEETRVNKRREVPPMTRYELTVRKDTGATLRDACEPERLFWHYAAPALLDRPDGVGDWSPDWSQGWSAPARPELLPAEVAARRLSRSPEVDLLASIVDRMGPGGRVWLVREFAKRMGVEVHGSLSRRSEALVGDSEAVSD